MNVILEEARGGGLMAKVDRFICFFDRWSLKRGVLRSATSDQHVDVMFTGKNRSGGVLFMRPLFQGARLMRHEGFQLIGKGMDLEVMAPSLNGFIMRGEVPIPALDGESRLKKAHPGCCWAVPVKHHLAKWKCVGSENPWNLVGMPVFFV